ELGRLAALGTLHRDGPSSAFPPDQVNALVSLSLDIYDRAIDIAALFWGLWLFPLGYLVFKSNFLPRMLGVALLIAGIGYPTQSLATFLCPERVLHVVLYTSWGEFLLASWLLVKGVHVERWERRAREALGA